MKYRLFATVLSIASTAALAQYVGPASPDAKRASAAATTVKQLLDSGKDDQYVTLQGQIISQERGKHYTFADASGKMKVEISPKLFPTGQPISATTKVEISGKFDKAYIGSSELEVKAIKVMS